MRKLIFLGTGPAGGIKIKEKLIRLESSALIKTDLGNILIDVTRHFQKQIKNIDRIDAILITHAHQDAIGGMAQLESWIRKNKKKAPNKIPLYALKKTIEKIKQKFKETTHLNFIPIQNFKIFKIVDVKILPFLVKHSIQRGFPTVGYRFLFSDHFSLVYVSDVSHWDKKAERLIKSADILIIDGAMWDKKMITHLAIKEILPRLCSWLIPKIIFTQMGKNVPKHTILQKEIKRICSRALPAYDGLMIKF